MSNSPLQEFIELLKDYELVAFYKYRFDSFLPKSQQRILNEIDKRGLDKQRLDNFELPIDIKESAANQRVYCPRCYSRHFYTAEEKDLITVKYESFELNNKFKTCLVCLYSQDKVDYNREKRRNWTIFHKWSFIRSRKYQ